jgi:DNA-binding Lrp family transcriptional regulator
LLSNGRFDLGELKPIDYRILLELMKNAKMSDRQLAEMLGVSQPTVSRRRSSLEKTLIDGYTAVPRWSELGYEIFAVTFFKTESGIRVLESYMKKQPNVIMFCGCQGNGMNGLSLSFHKSYSDYDEWFGKFRLECGHFLVDTQSVLVNLRGEEILKPLHLKYLAESKKEQ